jgi:hypothetical protein
MALHKIGDKENMIVCGDSFKEALRKEILKQNDSMSVKMINPIELIEPTPVYTYNVTPEELAELLKKLK